MANEHDLEPLLNTQQKQLSLVFSDSDSIDTKALAILAANVAILIFVNQTAGQLSLLEYLLLYGPFVFSLLLDLISIWPRPYIGAGAAAKDLKLYLNLPHQALVLQLLSDTQAAIKHNGQLNRQRLYVCYCSIALTSFGFLALLFIL